MNLANKYVSQLEIMTKEELLQQLSTYHEELLFQNQELLETNESLSILQSQYRNLFMESPIAYAIINDAHTVVQANAAFYLLFADSFKQTSVLSNFVCPESQDNYYLLFKKATDHGLTYNDMLCMVAGQNSSRLFVKMYVNHTTEFKGSYRVSIVDMTAEVQQRKQIEYMSYHDTLTGLYNRSFFETELHRLGVRRQFPIGLIMADVNGLKLVNDAFGHDQGDLLIANTAKAIKATCREEDIVARIGGDEFAVLVLQTTEEKVKHLMDRLIGATKFMGIGDITLSTSFGYSLWDSEDFSANDMMRQTEDRMYKHKLVEQTSYRRNMIDGIVATLHEKHPREEQHSERVGDYARKMAEALGLNDHTTSTLLTCARLHDIGKIALDYAILDKSKALDSWEFDEIRKHPETGFRILMYAMGLSDIANVVLTHHERIDGTGYPRGLKGDQIPLEARILSICDAFDAMISDRPYRSALSTSEAISQLVAGKGTQFDADLVDVFMGTCS